MEPRLSVCKAQLCLLCLSFRPEGILSITGWVAHLETFEVQVCMLGAGDEVGCCALGCLGAVIVHCAVVVSASWRASALALSGGRGPVAVCGCALTAGNPHFSGCD